MKSGEANRIPLLVIGYGNELRGDDGLGPYIAAQVGRWAELDSHVLIAPALTPELAETIATAERVLFIDARTERADQAVEVNRVEPSTGTSLFGHACDPAALLGLAQELFGRAPEACWLTVAGQNFEIGEGLSAQALANASLALPGLGRLLALFHGKDRS